MNTASATTETSPSMVRLADYRPPQFSTDTVNLSFQIFEDHTLVSSLVIYRRTEAGQSAEFLILDAQDPNPRSGAYIRQVLVDGESLDSASSAENTTCPTAAPGDAGNPRAITSKGCARSSVGCKS